MIELMLQFWHCSSTCQNRYRKYIDAEAPHSDSDWGFYRGNSKMNKFQIFQIFWAQMIDKVLIFDNSMPKDIWFHLNFNFLKVEVGCLC
jgi:hypothetical protein